MIDIGQVVDIPWLQPPKLQGHKTSQTDVNKRHEIFHEFLYYVFDSLLIPLIRSNFYVTESNTHRYQIFYFRHDVWKRIAEPAVAALKETMLEEVKLVDANRILSSRALGFSDIRLLPKGKDLRPIMNLRKRGLGREKGRGLGLSINTLLGPVHTLLKLEQVSSCLWVKAQSKQGLIRARKPTQISWDQPCSRSRTCIPR